MFDLLQMVRQNLPELTQLCGTRTEITPGNVRELTQERKQNVPDQRNTQRRTGLSDVRKAQASLGNV
jgi:hypothetical protein